MDDAVGSDTAGFTLIELLVVVAMLAVLAVGASLTATRRGSGQSDAQRFEQSFASARQLAVMGQMRRGLHITPRGSQGARRVGENWEDTGRETRWRGRVAFAATGPALPDGWPEVVILPNGRSNAFSVQFGGGSDGVACRSDGWAGLTCDGG